MGTSLVPSYIRLNSLLLLRAQRSWAFHLAGSGSSTPSWYFPVSTAQALKMVFSSSCWGLCRMACFQGIWKHLESLCSQMSPGYRPLSTWATSQGFSRTLRGWRAMISLEGRSGERRIRPAPGKSSQPLFPYDRATVSLDYSKETKYGNKLCQVGKKRKEVKRFF